MQNNRHGKVAGRENLTFLYQAGGEGAHDCSPCRTLPTLTAGFAGIPGVTLALVWSDTFAVFALWLAHSCGKRIPRIISRSAEHQPHSIYVMYQLSNRNTHLRMYKRGAEIYKVTVFWSDKHCLKYTITHLCYICVCACVYHFGLKNWLNLRSIL